MVNENLRLVEAQLNSFKQKTSTIMDSGVLPTSDPQVNFYQFMHKICFLTSFID